MIGDTCCTYIPPNPSKNGSFTKALNALKKIRDHGTAQTEKDDWSWDPGWLRNGLPL